MKPFHFLFFVFTFFFIDLAGQDGLYHYEQAYGYAFEDQSTFNRMDGNERIAVGNFNGHGVIANIAPNGEAKKWKVFKGLLPGAASSFTDIYTDNLTSVSTIVGLCTDCAPGRKGQVAVLFTIDSNFNPIPVRGNLYHFYYPKVDSFQVRDNIELLRLGNLIYVAYSGDSGFGTDIYLQSLSAADLSSIWSKQYNTNFFETPIMLDFDQNFNIGLGLHGWGKSRILKVSKSDGTIIQQFNFTDIPARFASFGNGTYAMAYMTNDSIRVSRIDTSGKETYVQSLKLNTTSTLSYAVSANNNIIGVACQYQVIEELPYWWYNTRVYFFNTALVQTSKPVQVILPENSTIGRNITQLSGSRESSFKLIGNRPNDGRGRAFYYNRDSRLFPPTPPTSWYHANYCTDTSLLIKNVSKTYPHTLPIIQNNILYATKPNYLNKPVALWLDVYRPYDHYARSSTDKRPAIIYIHGGGYVFGNEDGAANILLRAAQHGMIAIGVKYRIGRLPSLTDPDSLQSLIINSTQNTYRALQDVRDAVKWIYDRADQYHIDKSKIFLAGYSAGGNAVLNYAYLEEKDFTSTYVNGLGRLTPKTPIAGIISVAGPLNQLTESIKSPLDLIQPSENDPLYLIHGTCDVTAYYDKGNLVDPNANNSVGSYQIACRKQMLGHPYHFTTIKGGDHDLGIAEEEALTSVLQWIKKEVSCGMPGKGCDQIIVPNTAACFSVSTCPSCALTPTLNLSNATIKVYPNPTHNLVTLEIASTKALGDLTIKVHNIIGQRVLIHTGRLVDSKITINLESILSGMYVISLYDKETIIGKEVILKTF